MNKILLPLGLFVLLSCSSKQEQKQTEDLADWFKIHDKIIFDELMDYVSLDSSCNGCQKGYSFYDSSTTMGQFYLNASKNCPDIIIHFLVSFPDKLNPILRLSPGSKDCLSYFDSLLIESKYFRVEKYRSRVKNSKFMIAGKLMSSSDLRFIFSNESSPFDLNIVFKETNDTSFIKQELSERKLSETIFGEEFYLKYIMSENYIFVDSFSIEMLTADQVMAQVQ